MDVDWQDLFSLTVPPLELFVRGSFIYLLLFAIFRLVLRRDVGSVGMADVLVLVIIADAAQNGMSGEYRSITDATILIATIAGWNLLLDFLCYRFPALRRLLEARELTLIRDGRMIKANLRRELLTEEEVMSKLREQGVAELAEVRAAYMERDGNISVIKRK